MNRISEPRSRLRRLDRITMSSAIFFITFCTHERKKVLARPEVFEIIRDELIGAEKRHGWQVGRFIVMPDHVHLFCSPVGEALHDLSRFIGHLKQWTSRRLTQNLHLAQPLWQENFFDHLLRSDESYRDKADYMWQNPVRAGLVTNMEDWPYKDDLVPL